MPTHNALRLLTQAGYIEFIEEIETMSRVQILADKEELYSLRNSNSNIDVVLQAILRQYTGLFADYVNINEELISKKFGISQNDVYESLLALTRMHILHYIPRKRTPYILFTTSREETKYVLIPKLIYEEQKHRVEHRINFMSKYAYSTTECREKLMLEYFGDNSTNECGRCDVCLSTKKQSKYTNQDVIDGILYMLSNKSRIVLDFIETLSFPKDDIIKILSQLVDEGFVQITEKGLYEKK